MSLLSLDEARARILAAVPRLPAVTMPFEATADHVLAEAIVADADLPPWDNSAMDGFAVRAEDLAGAAPEAPVRLKVVGDLPAGRAPDRELAAGEAIRIMTGAPLPMGANAIAMVEITTSRGDEVEISAAVRRGESIRRAGENIKIGETALAAGTSLRAADIGLLASLGRTRVSVYRKPIVGLLSSGDELVPPDQTPGPGQIRDSNRFTLAVHLRRLGFPVIDFGNAPDREEAIEALFLKAAERCDALVSTGGVSVGDYDLTKQVLARLGQVDFWRIAIRPGKPLAFGQVAGKPAFGLPGNPVSSLVVLDQIVRPALRQMAGQTRLYRPTYSATLEGALRRQPGRTEFIRAVITWKDDKFVARSTGPQGSGILKSLALANGFIIIPSETAELPDGARVDCQLFAEEI
jgi:molybdopterin molybdotransferase